MNRRSFLAASTAALGGAWLAGCADTAEAPDVEDAADTAGGTGAALERIGLQLYTVRSLMEDDVAATLATVAEAGYDEVEFAGYFGHSPEEIRAMLDEVGLAAPAAHVPLETLRADLPGVLAAAGAVGHRYVVCPWLSEDDRQTLDQYRAHAAFFNEVGAACADAGVQLAYHNHEFEFEPIDGTIPYDVLLEETDPDLVQMELDLFWITEAGRDPLEYFDRWPGRFPLCHVKDRMQDGTMVDVGQGAIDFAALFAHRDHAGLRHFIVEHDNPDDPRRFLANSYDHLASLRV